MSKGSAIATVLIVTSRNVHYHEVAPVIDVLRRQDYRLRVLRFERIWEKVERLLSMTTRKRSLVSFYSKPEVERQGRIKSLGYRLVPNLVFQVFRVLGLEKPSILIVMTDSTVPCRLAVLTARLAEVPSLLLLHSGLIGWNYDCPTFISDKIAVISDFARRVLIANDVDGSKIVVTGRPSYDVLIRAQARFDKKEICSRLGLIFTKTIVVYTTENLPPQESEATIRAVCKALKEFQDVQFVIKVHPSELDLSIYRRVTKQLGLEALITRETSIYEILYVCDIMITGFSATALDAMIMDKPVVTLNPTGLKDPFPFAESGAAIGVYEEENLKEAIRRGLYDEDAKEKLRRARQRFVLEHAYRKDGKASERVVELVGQMTRNHKTA